MGLFMKTLLKFPIDFSFKYIFPPPLSVYDSEKGHNTYLNYMEHSKIIIYKSSQKQILVATSLYCQMNKCFTFSLASNVGL